VIAKVKLMLREFCIHNSDLRISCLINGIFKAHLSIYSGEVNENGAVTGSCFC